MPKDKWSFGVGTTSRVPNSGGLHYLIIDIDGEEWPVHLADILARAERIIIQETPHGWHFYTNWKMPFRTLVSLLKFAGADPAWIEIGERRGYYFLADKDMVHFSWPVEHMAIYYEKKTQNT